MGARLKVAFFDTHEYEKEAFEKANQDVGHEFRFIESRLTEETSQLAAGSEAVCSFVNDHLSRKVLSDLKNLGVKLIVLRSAGFNHVDLSAAQELHLSVARVPEYSPFAVAEHTAALVLTLNRKTHRSFNRTRELNFSLDGLVGFDLHGKTVGIIGTGRIGQVAAKIFQGFGCTVLGFDVHPSEALSREIRMEYVGLEELLKKSDIITLHVPLTPATRHLINAKAFDLMKNTALLINTGRGALIDTKALIGALKAKRIGGAGLDVYEEEEGVFFQNHSESGISDDVLARLLTFPNVIVTAHQAFLTYEALQNIAATTLRNLSDFENGRPLVNAVKLPPGKNIGVAIGARPEELVQQDR